jgi:hypothetical protein
MSSYLKKKKDNIMKNKIKNFSRVEETEGSQHLKLACGPELDVVMGKMVMKVLLHYWNKLNVDEHSISVLQFLIL